MHLSKLLLPSSFLEHVFPHLCKTQDEYLQHPGIGTTGRNDDTLDNPPQPASATHSQNAPQTNCSGCCCPATIPRRCSAQAHVKWASSLLRVYSQDGRWKVRCEGGSKSGSEVADGRGPKINLKHYLRIFPLCSSAWCPSCNEPANQTSEPWTLGFSECCRWISTHQCIAPQWGRPLSWLWESQSCKDLSGERRTWQSSSRALTGTRATRSWRAAPLDKVCPVCRAFFLRHSSKGTRMCFYSSSNRCACTEGREGWCKTRSYHHMAINH